MAVKRTIPKARMSRDRFLVTFQFRDNAFADWKPRRIIAVDIRHIPTGEHDARMWFMGLMARIWWDVTDTESAAVTSRMIDQFVALASTARREWQAEFQNGLPQDVCIHRQVVMDRATNAVMCRECGKHWHLTEAA